MKLAVVTLVTSPEWQQLAQLTLPSHRHYADRLGADFVVLDKEIYAHPQYSKWQVYDLLTEYERVIYLDADTIVRTDCPDLFVAVPPEFVAGENELHSYPGQAQNLADFCRRMNWAPLPCPYYLNSGVLVASSCHRYLFHPPEVVFADLPWPEQSHFNARLIRDKTPICFLPPVYNDRSRERDYLRQSFILHYACLSTEQRIAAITRDLGKWDRLFRRGPTDDATGIGSAPVADHDYISPGLQQVFPDAFFPNLMIGDKSSCPDLRRQVPHHWYVDRRAPTVGFLSRDEAHLLFNTARLYQGRRGLDIGCWLGWSACHMALAGMQVDAIDPILERADFRASVVTSLEAAGVRQRVSLVAGFSPQKIHVLAMENAQKWPFFFIDGNHKAPGPLEDARACAIRAEDDALILFHNLASPDVAAGLDYLKDQGWSTIVYDTMQIMGAAWRGKARPIAAIADPEVEWSRPKHLNRHYARG